MSTNPFVYISKLKSATTLLDDFSEILGEELAELDLPSSSDSLVEEDDTSLTVTYGGTMNDYDIDVTGDSSWDNIETLDGVTVGDKGELTYKKIDVDIEGIGDLVDDGFSTFMPETITTTSKKVQSLTFSLGSKGSITPAFDYDLEVDADICLDGECTSSYSTSTSDSGTLDSVDVSVTADLVVEIDYDKSGLEYTIEKYTIENLSITPNFETIWDSVYSDLFESVTDWWDDSISGETNPFTDIEDEVKDQLESVDTYIEEEIASELTDLINSGSVKDDLDDSFEGLLDYSWNSLDYPCDFSKSFRVDPSSRSFARSSVNIEDLESLMDLTVKSSKRKYIHESENKASLNRDVSSNMPHSFVFFREKGFGAKNSDTITNFNSKQDYVDLSNMKFADIEDLKFAAVSSKKQLNKQKKRSSNIIYDERSGSLYYDENASRSGFGKGGMFAVFESVPQLSDTSFEIV